jgi:predicted DNA-binding transcriptional regulator AlpA
MTTRAPTNRRGNDALLAPRPWPVRVAELNAGSDKLTLAQLCDELQIARSTFYDWRAKGRAPKCIKLPNGDLRVRRADLERWLADHEEPA